MSAGSHHRWLLDDCADLAEAGIRLAALIRETADVPASVRQAAMRVLSMPAEQAARRAVDDAMRRQA